MLVFMRPFQWCEQNVVNLLLLRGSVCRMFRFGLIMRVGLLVFGEIDGERSFFKVGRYGFFNVFITLEIDKIEDNDICIMKEERE
ncbi:hypothetical protein COO04_06840 [Bacillus toyonensis]|uniref:hypothetical protein n=1 Tax=Bacillus cereus group sp. N31 TaxID=2794594 RepID=UPI000BEDDBB0|nr:hypothetical protein [Bacillus cereus group sp. N31]PEG16690.1 hypothetical protein COO04_06840 [Bacillus toyonensis]MBJ7929606.1 hypothetical protein [Bacillus cereus group sp. N31]PEK07397.1 hypothetical protein CN681_22180 [Bacillus toyonensis]PGA53287.1 hypothetical protein COL86_21280 [Bacillus toyonensis]PGC05539.1 hypothetical protein COM19_01600 [Bacillus toyonensis]